MTTLYGNLWSALGSFIQSWMLPSVLGVGFFTIVLLPHIEEHAPWSDLSNLSTTQAALWFAFATLAVSFALGVASRPLFRLLEGYTLWPKALKDRWTKSQQRRRRDLFRQIEQETSTLGEALLREKLNQFPRKSAWVLPTRLGNAMRAAETYGRSQYGLSTVVMWTRLVAVVDSKVTSQLSQSRSILDFFVAMIGLSGVLAVLTVTVAVSASEATLLLWLLLLAGLMPLWYGRAVASVSWHAQAMHALVDLGRVPLAEKLGLRLPGDLEAEVEIWKAVTSYTDWGNHWDGTSRWLAEINNALVERGASAPGSRSSDAGPDPA